MMLSLSSGTIEVGQGEPELSAAATPHRSLREAAIARGLDTRRGEAEMMVEAIMAAGRELIERHGVLDFNMRELLTRSGVSNRAFYRFFGTKGGARSGAVG